MAKTILLLGMMAFAAPVWSEPVRLLDPAHPQIVVGVYDNLKGGKDAGSSLAILTYKAAGVELVPLCVGTTLGRGLGGPSVALGASANLLPPVKAGFRLILTALYPDSGKFANLKAILAPPTAGQPDIVMSIGPNASYVLYDGLHGKTLFTVFYGAQWKW